MRSAPLDALVWRRSDFRESSRVVTLLTREHGKVRAFAKGAHRPDSVMLGKIDFLNLVRIELWRRGDTMPLLSRVQLVHEPRALREPARFQLAGYLVELVDAALPDDRADPALCDLVHGGVLLLERCPARALAAVLCGLEWRFLRVLGLQPEVDACAETGAPLPPRARAAVAVSGRGFVPAAAAAPGASILGPATRQLLRALAAPGRDWPSLQAPAGVLADALALLGRLVAHGLERTPRARAAAVRAALQSAAPPRD